MRIKWIYLYIALLISLSLACGVSAQLPEVVTQEAILTPSQEVGTTSTAYPVYIVTAETLNIRSGAGEEFEELDSLNYGENVTCFAIETALDGGLWCKHEKGYSNVRYMKGLK